MTSLLSRFKKKEESTLTPQQQELIDEYRKVVREMHDARNAFENATDPKLVESFIYEMNAIQSRHTYLLSLIKEENLTAQM